MPQGAYLRLLLFFLGPAVLVYTLFSIYPLLATILNSFYSRQSDGSHLWAGLGNFHTLLLDPTWSGPFWNALKNNVIFFLIHMSVQNPIGLLLAALLSLPRLRFRATYRTLIFMPTMLSVVVIGFVWQLILSPLWGIARMFLNFFGLGFLFAPWLGVESSALITVSLISVWQFVGIPMILIYTALLAIPDELIDAATVDGLNQFQAFMWVKLPLIWPTIGLVSILTFVNNFNAFDLIYAMKGALAGPNFSTDIMGTLFYRTFFGNQLQLGNPAMGSAIATMMLIIILIGVMAYLFLVQRRIQRYSF
ncbi:carbohydrate ABC transporter permease [Aestuariivirga sp.]|uniref:carbohydrate ABC transporter permease n=1 Tax=Aestuariivirga sp. TaxID=2650926 RepID=UPI0025BB5A9A|nr:sugar ABC transporter permease [Aestuariivirga sp.]MCA3555458.1 sugar ABC transporter permease [Aestuariivirga sp.]